MIDTGMVPILQTFGISVEYHPSSGEDFSIDGVFDEKGLVLDTSGDIPVETRQPLLCVRKADFAGRNLPKKGDMVTIRGVLYEVTLLQDDGWAEMRLVLKRRGAESYD
jgi:hypothetical protein